MPTLNANTERKLGTQTWNADSFKDKLYGSWARLVSMFLMGLFFFFLSANIILIKPIKLTRMKKVLWVQFTLNYICNKFNYIHQENQVAKILIF